MLVAGGTWAVAVLLRPGLAGVRAMAAAAPGHGVAGLQEICVRLGQRLRWLAWPEAGAGRRAQGARAAGSAAGFAMDEEVEGSTER